MTDRTKHRDRDERIRRLQERRGAAGLARPPERPANTETASASSRSSITSKRPRRGHPAVATRWLLAGLSVASFFTIAGTVAVANQANLTGAQPASSTGASAVTNSPGPSTAATSATPRATTNSTTAPAAHTTTRAS